MNTQMRLVRLASLFHQDLFDIDGEYEDTLNRWISEIPLSEMKTVIADIAAYLEDRPALRALAYRLSRCGETFFYESEDEIDHFLNELIVKMKLASPPASLR